MDLDKEKAIAGDDDGPVVEDEGTDSLPGGSIPA
jgi:hypothetical protein